MLSAQLRLGADLGGKLGGTIEGEDLGSIGMAMGFSLAYDHMSVSYTHLTLPTILLV